MKRLGFILPVLFVLFLVTTAQAACTDGDCTGCICGPSGSGWLQQDTRFDPETGFCVPGNGMPTNYVRAKVPTPPPSSDPNVIPVPDQNVLQAFSGCIPPSLKKPVKWSCSTHSTIGRPTFSTPPLKPTTPEGELARAFGLPQESFPLIEEAVVAQFTANKGRAPSPTEKNDELDILFYIPGARLDLAPYLLAAAHKAIITHESKRTPAQQAFYARFQPYFAGQQDRKTVGLLEAWEAFKGYRLIDGGAPRIVHQGQAALVTQSDKTETTLTSLLTTDNPKLVDFAPPESHLDLGETGEEVIAHIGAAWLNEETDQPESLGNERAREEYQLLLRTVLAGVGTPTTDIVLGAFGEGFIQGLDRNSKLVQKMNAKIKNKTLAEAAEAAGTKISGKTSKVAVNAAKNSTKIGNALGKAGAKVGAKIGAKLSPLIATGATAILGGVLPAVIEIVIGVTEAKATQAFDRSLFEQWCDPVTEPDLWTLIGGKKFEDMTPIEALQAANGPFQVVRPNKATQQYRKAFLTYGLKMMFGDPADFGHLMRPIVRTGDENTFVVTADGSLDLTPAAQTQLAQQSADNNENEEEAEERERDDDSDEDEDRDADSDGRESDPDAGERVPQYSHLLSRGSSGSALGVKDGTATMTAFSNGGQNLEWEVVSLPNPAYVLITSRSAPDSFLAAQGGEIVVATGEPEDHASLWEKEPVPGTHFITLRNLAHKNLFLVSEGNELRAAAGDPASAVTHWLVQPVGAPVQGLEIGSQEDRDDDEEEGDDDGND